MRYYGKDFWNAVHLLREHVPLSAPVTVRTVTAATLTQSHGEPCYGDCTPFEKDGAISHYRIRIARGMTVQCAIDTVIHEFAHALDFDTSPNTHRDCHRQSWGAAYAQCYKAVFG